MAKHVVRVKTDFVHETKLGALTVTHVNSGEKEIIDGERTLRTDYKAGQEHTFHRKPDAMAFVKAHGDKVEYIGKI